MPDLRVNELLIGDRVVVDATAHTLRQEAESRTDVWLGVYGIYYRVIYTGAYNYLTVLKAVNKPHDCCVECVVLYSGPEDRNTYSEAVLASHHAKLLLLKWSDDLITTYCY